MTSVSPQNSIPSQASNTNSASQSTLSYASTAKKAVSSPPVATSSSTPSPAVAVGGSVPVQHGKSSSIAPVNGRPSVVPAVPTVSGPAIAHGSSTNGASEHGRQPSVTINAGNNGNYTANGGPVGGSKPIQFGSLQDSPAPSHSTPQSTNVTPSAPIAIASNPRVISPTHSPSPIPQSATSGGRPPSGLQGQGNGMTFGSLGGDGDRHMRQASGNQGPLAPNTPQAGHLRRESSQSSHNDVGHQNQAANRGGFGQGGRGRGGYNNNSYQQQQIGYPQNQSFRGPQGQGRGGMVAPFQGQGRGGLGFPGSPHQPTRSPALANSIPNTPNMNPSIPLQNGQQYNGYYGMPQHQVNNFSNMQSSEFNQPSFKGNRRNTHKQWRGGNEKFSSNRQRPRAGSKELFSHSYVSRVPDSYGQVDGGNYSMSNEQMRFGPPAMPGNGPSSSQSRQRVPSDGQSIEQAPFPFVHPHSPPNAIALPPFPPPFIMHSQNQPINVRNLDIRPESNDFDTFLELTKQQQNYQGFPPHFQPGMQMGGNQAMFYPQVAQMQYGHQQSPQGPYQQPYGYPPQAQPMSRNSSQISEHRPASSMGGPQTPSITPSIVAHTPQPKPATTLSSSFSKPSRKSAAIVIKRPDGEALDLDSIKVPASPAHSQRAKTPPVIASTPTPPPKVATPQHNRTESATVVSTKSKEQIQKEIQEKVAAAASNTAAAAESKEVADEAARAAELKVKEDEKAKKEAEAAAEAKAKEEAEAKAAAEKAKADEEELERQIAEMEAAELEREKKEAELLAKRAADKLAADKANEAKRLADAAENDRKLKEAEREMERLEDEKERKRAEAEAKTAGADADVKKDVKADSKEERFTPTTPSTLASKLSNLTLRGTESGASTPTSDDSMGPPPSKVSLGTEKKSKPAHLILNTKPVEAPQPSAALQSLKSARFLSVLNSSIYPEGIASPNPALNNAVTTKGKSFKYDKEFLLQFQKVFTEKPSLEFESQIKNLIGDGDGGARSASVRTPGGMGPRQNSTRNQPGNFAMGSFGAIGGGKTLPPGTTSDQRYAMATGSMARPSVNPMASFNRPGGAFPGNMSRQPSSTNMNHPNSPRQQSSSRRGGGSKRDNFQPSNAKAEAAAAKTMPLTAGMELKPIQVSATGWKPTSIQKSQSATGAAGPAPGASGTGHMEPDMVQRKVKAALNKMTPEKFDKIADQILSIAAQSKDEQDGRTLRQVIQLTFEKATDEAHWASMYARFCKRMLETMSPDIKDESILDKNGNVVSGGNLFRKYLLNRCQEEFERGWKTELPEKPEGERGEEKSEEAAMLSDEYYIAAAAKRRGLGLVQFIGELYKLSMLTERIMHECVKKLVDYTGIPDEAEIESLTKLLKTIGANLDSTEKGKPIMDIYFTRIQAMIDTPELPSRLKFMLMDIVDLRKARWVSKEANKGPKTLDEIKAEADALQAQKAAESARGNQRGGGRMQIGRGDSRNFSGGYGNQPPVDYQKNTVGMDDLRRLTNKNASNRSSNQPMSFGPTSMFSSRSNSGRKMGPGGSLSRTGEESGASSRTGTPPQQKEKESATSTNAFSLLAALGSGEENPASPPSANTSPVLTKSTPASAEKAEAKNEE